MHSKSGRLPMELSVQERSCEADEKELDGDQPFKGPLELMGDSAHLI